MIDEGVANAKMLPPPLQYAPASKLSPYAACCEQRRGKRFRNQKITFGNSWNDNASWKSESVKALHY